MTDTTGSPYADWCYRTRPLDPALSPFRERWWVPYLMATGDGLFVATVVSAWLGADLLQHPEGFGSALSREAWVAWLAVVVLPLGWCAAGLVPGYGLCPVERVRRYLWSSALAATTLVAGDLLLLDGAGWGVGLLLVLLVVLALRPVLEYVERWGLHSGGVWGRPVAIVGASRPAVQVMRRLREDPLAGYIPVGFLEDRMNMAGGRREYVPLLGRIEEADRLQPHVRMAIVVLPRASVARLNRVVNGLPFQDVIIVPDLYGFQSLGISARDVSGLLGLRITRNLHLWWVLAFKRLIDLTVGSALLMCSLPLLALCALGIKLVDPGPVFFRHQRVGQHGRSFPMIKLRTMYSDAEARLEQHLAADPQARDEWQRLMKLRYDPRILPGIGHLIRKLSLDELPQFWHVVRGEMSLVGPRPFPAYHVSRFEQEFRDLRASVRPGLTGLWQVAARNNGDLEAQQALDMYYIRNWSPWLDLYILLRTIRAVVSSSGAF